MMIRKLVNEYIGKHLIIGSLFAVVGFTCGMFASSQKQVTIKTPEDVKFVPTEPNNPNSSQMAVLWGKPDTGPSAVLMKFKKLSGPLHYHSSDYHAVVLKGTMKHRLQGENEAEVKTLSEGSYWFQPGSQLHGDSCQTDECIIFVKWEGVRDRKLAQSQ